MSWELTSKPPLRDANGRIIGTCGITRGITERKLAELFWRLSLMVHGRAYVEEGLKSTKRKSRKPNNVCSKSWPASTT